jgi:sugar phosphate permease
MWQALRHRDVLLLVGAYFFATVGFYGLNIWMPTILKAASGWSDFKVTMVAMMPHLAGLGGMLAFGWSSDRTGERRWHAAGAMLLGAAGYLLVVAGGASPCLLFSPSALSRPALTAISPGSGHCRRRSSPSRQRRPPSA